VIPDWASFPVADDHRYLGRDSVIADHIGGARPISASRSLPTIPVEPLRVRKDPRVVDRLEGVPA
jgi:hypothetical protein